MLDVITGHFPFGQSHVANVASSRSQIVMLEIKFISTYIKIPTKTKSLDGRPKERKRMFRASLEILHCDADLSCPRQLEQLAPSDEIHQAQPHALEYDIALLNPFAQVLFVVS